MVEKKKRLPPGTWTNRYPGEKKGPSYRKPGSGSVYRVDLPEEIDAEFRAYAERKGWIPRELAYAMLLIVAGALPKDLLTGEYTPTERSRLVQAVRAAITEHNRERGIGGSNTSNTSNVRGKRIEGEHSWTEILQAEEERGEERRKKALEEALGLQTGSYSEDEIDRELARRANDTKNKSRIRRIIIGRQKQRMAELRDIDDRVKMGFELTWEEKERREYLQNRLFSEPQ